MNWDWMTPPDRAWAETLDDLFEAFLRIPQPLIAKDDE